MIPYGLQTRPLGPTDVAAETLCVCPMAFGFADTVIIIIIIIFMAGAAPLQVMFKEYFLEHV